MIEIDYPITEKQKVLQYPDVLNPKVKLIANKMEKAVDEILMSASCRSPDIISKFDMIRWKAYMQDMAELLEVFDIDPEQEQNLESENKYLRRRLRKLEKKLRSVDKTKETK